MRTQWELQRFIHSVQDTKGYGLFYFESIWRVFRHKKPVVSKSLLVSIYSQFSEGIFYIPFDAFCFQNNRQS